MMSHHARAPVAASCWRNVADNFARRERGACFAWLAWLAWLARCYCRPWQGRQREILEAETKTMWPDRRILNLFKTEFPIALAPMAGAMDADLAVAVAQGGGLGSVPCALVSVEKAREQVNIIRQCISAPVNLNFFCHEPVDADAASEAKWKGRLTAYYEEHGIDFGQSRALRCGDVRAGRGVETRDRQLPFR